MISVENKFIQFYQTLLGFYYRYFKNKYVTTLTIFLIWMLFFDNDSIVHQFQRKYQIIKLNREIKYYSKELQETKIEEKALNQSNEYFEKFVREKYLLKKKNEDLFIFSEEE